MPLSLFWALFQSLKRKCLHFDEIFITGCTGSCQNDNFQCSQWLKFRQIDDIFVSVIYWIRSLSYLRPREVSKPRDWQIKSLHRFEIWQAHRQHCCRCTTCQISERLHNSKYKSRGFETLRDLTDIVVIPDDIAAVIIIVGQNIAWICNTSPES